MIVEPDFCDHWKTRMVVTLLGGDEAAPVYIMRLWSHCQNRRQWNFENLSAAALAAICRCPGNPQVFEDAMTEAGFVSRDENSSLYVCGWDDYNAGIIASWENGKKGGRPPKPPKVPPKNPRVTHGLTQEPKLETHGVTDKSREDKSREEEKQIQRPAPADIASQVKVPPGWDQSKLTAALIAWIEHRERIRKRTNSIALEALVASKVSAGWDCEKFARNVNACIGAEWDNLRDADDVKPNGKPPPPTDTRKPTTGEVQKYFTPKGKSHANRVDTT